MNPNAIYRFREGVGDWWPEDHEAIRMKFVGYTSFEDDDFTIVSMDGVGIWEGYRWGVDQDDIEEIPSR